MALVSVYTEHLDDIDANPLFSFQRSAPEPSAETLPQVTHPLTLPKISLHEAEPQKMRSSASRRLSFGGAPEREEICKKFNGTIRIIDG